MTRFGGISFVLCFLFCFFVGKSCSIFICHVLGVNDRIMLDMQVFCFFLHFCARFRMFIVNGCHDFLGEMPLLVDSFGNLAIHHTNLELVLAQETNIPIVVLQRPKKHQ